MPLSHFGSMIHSSWQLLILLISAVIGTSMVAAAAAEDELPLLPENGTTVYEILPMFGLPPGLLPDTVSSFSLAKNGAFEVNLAGDCYVDSEYIFHYDPKITGVIRYGEISDLKGIQVRHFFIWINVEAIKVNLPPSDYIYFYEGLIAETLHVDSFKSVHSCRKTGLSDIMLEKGPGSV